MAPIKAWAELRRRAFASAPIAALLLAALISAAAGTVLAGPSLIQPLSSTPRPDEVDTADNDGQIGGFRVGIHYQLRTLRCPYNQAIVGMGIGGHGAIDAMDIHCARPVCGADGCNWAQATTISAGDSSSKTRMLCARNEMMSGVRGRVRVIDNPMIGYKFDYADDIAIKCSPITSEGPMFAIGEASAGAWHHASGHLANAAGSYLTNPISCQTGGVTAVSLGIADDVRRRGHRVIQAVSLYCPATQQVAGKVTPLPKPYSDLSEGARLAARACLKEGLDPQKDWRAFELCILKETESARLPRLFSGKVEAWAHSDTGYNCYAYAIPKPHQWVGPRETGPRPGDFPVESSKELFNLFMQAGWTEIPIISAPPAAGEERAVLYAKPGGLFQHAAIWKTGGVFAKMGELGVFRFDDPEQMSGGNFGNIAKMYSRPAPQ